MATDTGTKSYRFDREFIGRLTNTVDGPGLVQRFVKLKQVGGRHVGLCPFHSDSKPSFYVRENGSFHCFGCQKHGSVFDFLMETNNLSFTDAVKEVAQFAGIPLPESKQRSGPTKEQVELYDVLEKATLFFEEQLKLQNSNSPVTRYLERRGLDCKVQEQFRIGFAPNGWTGLHDHFKDTDIELLIKADVVNKNEERNRTYDRFRNRLMFPIRNRSGHIVGFGGRALDDSEPKYLNSKQTPVFFKSRELYGLYEALGSNRRPSRILLTEGYMDVIALAQFGINYALATLGTASNSSHFQQAFWHTHEVVCCFDGDEAGRKAANRALEAALPQLDEDRTIRFMFLPEGEDPDTLVRAIGTEKFEQLVDESQYLADYFVSIVHQTKDRKFSSIETKFRFIKRANQLIASVKSKSMQQILRQDVARCFEDTEGIKELLESEVAPTEPPYEPYDFDPTAISEPPNFNDHSLPAGALKSVNYNDMPVRHRTRGLMENPSIWPLLKKEGDLLELMLKIAPEEPMLKAWEVINQHDFTHPDQVISYFQEDQELALHLSQATIDTKQEGTISDAELVRSFVNSVRGLEFTHKSQVNKDSTFKSVKERMSAKPDS